MLIIVVISENINFYSNRMATLQSLEDAEEELSALLDMEWDEKPQRVGSTLFRGMSGSSHGRNTVHIAFLYCTVILLATYTIITGGRPRKFQDPSQGIYCCTHCFI
jgi:hypothetical protein